MMNPCKGQEEAEGSSLQAASEVRPFKLSITKIVVEPRRVTAKRFFHSHLLRDIISLKLPTLTDKIIISSLCKDIIATQEIQPLSVIDIWKQESETMVKLDYGYGYAVPDRDDQFVHGTTAKLAGITWKRTKESNEYAQLNFVSEDMVLLVRRAPLQNQKLARKVCTPRRGSLPRSMGIKKRRAGRNFATTITLPANER
jgi:hypothetical protein